MQLHFGIILITFSINLSLSYVLYIHISTRFSFPSIQTKWPWTWPFMRNTYLSLIGSPEMWQYNTMVWFLCPTYHAHGDIGWMTTWWEPRLGPSLLTTKVKWEDSNWESAPPQAKMRQINATAISVSPSTLCESHLVLQTGLGHSTIANIQSYSWQTIISSHQTTS